MLDGGLLLVLLIEGLRGRPCRSGFSGLHAIGLVLLLGLSAVLIVKDTSQLSLGVS